MICKNCDSVIEDNATACPYCLTPVNAVGGGQKNFQDGGSVLDNGWNITPPPQGGGNPNLVIGIITGLLGLGFLVEAFLYFVVLTP